MEEITATARRLLVEQGPEAASLRAIAREMGMTAPGLYRYYSNREELIRHVIAEIFRELSDAVRQAIAGAVPPASQQDDPKVRYTLKLVAACREFRRWTLSHKDEFGLLFGVPLPVVHDAVKNDLAEQCAQDFAETFYQLFFELWGATKFPVPADADIDPALRAQLVKFRAKFWNDEPDGAVLVFLRCWVLLYGALALEAFGHLDFALADTTPMFELTLSELAARVGLTYPLPAPPG